MITNTTHLSESQNLDLLDAAALDAFAQASKLAAVQSKAGEPAVEAVKLTDGLVSDVNDRVELVTPGLQSSDLKSVAQKDDAKVSTEVIELEPVKVPTNFAEYWAVTERPKTFNTTVTLLRTAAAPLVFAKDMLASLTRSMTRMAMTLFRPTMKPTPDVGEALAQQMATQRKDDQQVLLRIREEIVSDVAQAERVECVKD